MSPAIHVEPAPAVPDPLDPRKKPLQWTWRCDCHPGLAATTPWSDRPSPENAAAEHDLVIVARELQPRGAWVR